jgi:hypothetical protein
LTASNDNALELGAPKNANGIERAGSDFREA